VLDIQAAIGAEPDGVAGTSFDSAVKAFQMDNNIPPDGELTAGGNSWSLLLGINR